MKEKRLFLKRVLLLLSAMFFMLPFCADTVTVRAEEEMSEWTVLFYFCGSDLESQYSYASQNLEDIADCRILFDYYQAEIEHVYGGTVDEEDKKQPGNVNVLIQTGGCSEWHTENLGIDVDENALQRWRFEIGTDLEKGTFQLEQSLPLASMAAPETLSDFIRWGTETCPAKKTLLVLWDHGGGSKTGLFVDELYDYDVMYLDELGTALRDSGAHMDLVLFDACMMANLETACVIKDSADWMVASEELVAGRGTAIASWLQQLFFTPEAEGEEVGRWICDMTQIQYGDGEDEGTKDMMTWSLVDLSKVERVNNAFDQLFCEIGQIYANYPELMQRIADGIVEAEYYGTGQENLWDLSGVFFEIQENIGARLYREMQSALRDAVVYCVRGTDRAGARGLSFCYAVDFSASELDVYSHNCPSLHYMAFLDAITPWSAPESIYESVERLPEIDTLTEYQVNVKKSRRSDGTPGFEVIYNDTVSTVVVRYNLVRLDNETGNQYWLGTLPASMDYQEDGENSQFLFTAVEPWMWPALEEIPCTLDVFSINRPGWTSYVGSIPIRIDTENWNLRCGYNKESSEYTVYGLWAGSDSDGSLFNRNVSSLSKMAGQEFSTLYPVYSGDGDISVYYQVGDTATLYRAMEVSNQPLPAGTYYLRYLVYDMFMRPHPLEWIQMEWDGQQATFPEPESWEGEETLDLPVQYWE